MLSLPEGSWEYKQFTSEVTSKVHHHSGQNLSPISWSWVLVTPIMLENASPKIALLPAFVTISSEVRACRRLRVCLLDSAALEGLELLVIKERMNCGENG